MTPREPAATPVREAPRPKTSRVYKTVSVDEKDGRFRVLLDGRPVLTPLRVPLHTAGRAMADAVAAEWDAQNPHIDPETMPITRLVSTALDKVAPGRDAHINELMKYIDADLLCYRAAYPADLKARQQTVWQPVLDWAAAAHGIAMTTTEGLMPASQPATAGEALRKAIAALDDERLTAFQACAAICNSLVLSLALAHGRISASEAFAASSLDETYQLEQWGEDELAVQRRRNIENDLLGIGEYLRLLKLP